jgi:hypothetical protein
MAQWDSEWIKRFGLLGPSTVWQAVEKLAEEAVSETGSRPFQKRLPQSEAIGLTKWLLYEKLYYIRGEIILYTRKLVRICVYSSQPTEASKQLKTPG